MKTTIKKLRSQGLEVGPSTEQGALYVTLPAGPMKNGRRLFYEVNALIWPIERQWEILGTPTRAAELKKTLSESLPTWLERGERSTFTDLASGRASAVEFYASPAASGTS